MTLSNCHKYTWLTSHLVQTPNNLQPLRLSFNTVENNVKTDIATFNTSVVNSSIVKIGTIHYYRNGPDS